MSVANSARLPMGESSTRARGKETLWRLSSLACAHPVPELHQALLSGEFHEAFSAAWNLVNGRPWMGFPVEDHFDHFEAGYIGVFLHASDGKPAAPLLAGDHEVALAGLSRPVFMLNLISMYKHFGLQAATADEGRQDEPDHLSSMMEFMAVLCHLEANSLEKKRDASAPRRAQRDFLCRYLKPVLQAIAGKLRHKRAAALDQTLSQVLQDMAFWIDQQIAELEERVGPFRDPDAPKTQFNLIEDQKPANQNLWG